MPLDREQPFDVTHMERAMMLARRAEYFGERPFGCVIGRGPELIGEGLGSEETLAGKVIDPTRHSEMVAIREACLKLRGPLHGCTIYSTHEPCPMCWGAIKHAKLSRVVFGSYRSDLPQLFRPLNIDWKYRAKDSSNPPEVLDGFFRDECCALFAGELSALANERAGQ